MLGPLIWQSVNFVDERTACGDLQNAHKLDISRGEFLENVISLSFSRPSCSLIRIKWAKHCKRIKVEGITCRGNFIVLVAQVLSYSQESRQCNGTTVPPKEARCFTLLEVSKHFILSRLVFFQLDVNRMKAHLSRRCDSHKTIPPP